MHLIPTFHASHANINFVHLVPTHFVYLIPTPKQEDAFTPLEEALTEAKQRAVRFPFPYLNTLSSRSIRGQIWYTALALLVSRACSWHNPPLSSTPHQPTSNIQVSEAKRLKPLDPQAALEAFKQSKEWEAKLVELQVRLCVYTRVVHMLWMSVYLSLHSICACASFWEMNELTHAHKRTHIHTQKERRAIPEAAPAPFRWTTRSAFVYTCACVVTLSSVSSAHVTSPLLTSHFIPPTHGTARTYKKALEDVSMDKLELAVHEGSGKRLFSRNRSMRAGMGGWIDGQGYLTHT